MFNDMSSHKRAPSLDLTSVELHHFSSPAPTYSSTFDAQDVKAVLAAQARSLNTPYNQSTIDNFYSPQPESKDKTPQDTQEDEVKPDYHDPNHPHFAGQARHDEFLSRPVRKHLPRKRIVVPWILAIVFFVTTLWCTSILLGAHFFSKLHPFSAGPAIQAINVYINGELLNGTLTPSASVTTKSLPSISTTASFKSSSATVTPSSTFSSALPTATEAVLAPVPLQPPSDNTGNNQGTTLALSARAFKSAPTGFVTVIRHA